MFCPECGNSLEDGQKFCPKCGTPVEGNGRQADTGTSQGSGESWTSGASSFEQAGSMGNKAGGAQNGNNNLEMVMRIVCGVFAVFFLVSALRRIPGLFSTLFGLRIGYFIAAALGFASALVMTLCTAVSAWKWSSKLRNLVFGGAILGVALRFLSLIVQIIANLITFGGFIDGKVFLYWFGYIFTAVVLFGLMYAMGCAPLLGETKDSFTASMSEGFSELSGAAKELQKQQAAKNAERQKAAAAGYQAPPQGTAAGYQTAGDAAGYQAPPTGGAAGYQAPPQGGTAPGYGMPPMGGYGMPTTPPRGMTAKKTDRSIWMYVLLSIVTCGIYSYYFVYKLAEDVNDLCEGDGENTSGIVAFILLGMVTCGIYTIVWWYKLANRLQANGPRYNVPIQENGTTYLLWVLLGSLLCGLGPFIALNFVIQNTNKLSVAYNQYNGLR